MRSTDSLSLRMLTFPQRTNELLQPSLLQPLNTADSAEMESLRSEFLRSQMLTLPATYPDRFDLTSTVRLQSQSDDRYQFLRSAFTAMLAGGEAYMVYLAMKKYGYIR